MNASTSRRRRSASQSSSRPASLATAGAEVVWAARAEMARKVEDVLARRTRALFLNARAAVQMAPAVARLAGRELDWDADRQRREVDAFTELAQGYMLS